MSTVCALNGSGEVQGVITMAVCCNNSEFLEVNEDLKEVKKWKMNIEDKYLKINVGSKEAIVYVVEWLHDRVLCVLMMLAAA